MIKKFDSNLEYVSSIEVKSNVFRFYSKHLFCRNGDVFNGIIEPKFTRKGSEGFNNSWKSKLLVKITFKSGSEQVLGRYDPELKELLSTNNRPVFSINYENQKIYSTHENSFRVRILDLVTGKELNSFGLKTQNFKVQTTDPENFPLFSEARKKIGLEQSLVQRIHVTSDKKYLFLYFVNTTEEFSISKSLNDVQHYLVVYDLNSNNSLVGELNVGAAISGFNNNKILTIDNEDPRNYELTWKKVLVN